MARLTYTTFSRTSAHMEEEREEEKKKSERTSEIF